MEWIRRNDGKVSFAVAAIFAVLALAIMEFAYTWPHFGAGERSSDRFGIERVRWGGFDRSFLDRRPDGTLIFGQYDGFGGMVASLWDWHQGRQRSLNVFVLGVRHEAQPFTYERCVGGREPIFEMIELRGRRYKAPVIHSNRFEQACATLDEGLRRFSHQT